MYSRLLSNMVLSLIWLVASGTVACTPDLAECSDHLNSPNGSVPFGNRACSPDCAQYAREVEPADQGQIGIFDQAANKLLMTIEATEQDNQLK